MAQITIKSFSDQIGVPPETLVKQLAAAGISGKTAADSLTEEEITVTIRDVSVRKDLITILIAHRLSTVIHADRIYVLERGKIVESGRHEDLLELKGLYYAMWRQQIGERSFRGMPTSTARVTV